jgi:DNA-binding NarL/FixJ family response regulator
LNLPRVLVADNHPALLRTTSALLSTQFDVVGTVADGESLVSKALSLCPDVIVADITLPVLSGIEAVHRLRVSAPSAKIVFLTIHSEQQSVDACKAEGALGYVLKPQMRAHLIPAISAALAEQSYICPFGAT